MKREWNEERQEKIMKGRKGDIKKARMKERENERKREWKEERMKGRKGEIKKARMKGRENEIKRDYLNKEKMNRLENEC